MSKRLLHVAMLLASAWLAQAATAGELTLYSRSNFSGRELTLRGSATDLSRAGFDDRASSMMVHSGRWEVCTRPEFRGRCSTVERGEFPTLERFSDRISSIREIDGGRGDWRERDDRRDERRDERRDDRRGEWRNDGRNDGRADGRYDGRPGYERPEERSDDVEMFADAKFLGMRANFSENVPNLRKLNMNDRADSIIVHRGVWEFCVDADYRGQCVTYTPGRYERLGTMGSVLSSARRIR